MDRATDQNDKLGQKNILNISIYSKKLLFAIYFMSRVQKRPFSMDFFQMFIWGGTVFLGEPVAENYLLLWNQAKFCEFWSFLTKTKNFVGQFISGRKPFFTIKPSQILCILGVSYQD